ncbi:MAG: type 1 glutamine amidotransferase [Deltaproteobacteria bacterium]|nr:type 1 glutamine amidotransferase [Deltaproteobacteria bacterium]
MIILIQNDPEVPPGLLLEALRRSSTPYRVLRPDQGEPLKGLAEAVAVIVLGGKMGVDDLAEFPFLVQIKEFIRATLAGGIPFLGICLGGQLLAQVTGGRVISRANEELGCHPISVTSQGEADPIFASLPQQFITFQWHHDSFVPPAGAALLASSDRCPHQAFRFGNSAYGFQFHPEATPSIVALWSADTPQSQDIKADFQEKEAAYRRISLTVLTNFLNIAKSAR